jgi:hypothetical protein
MSHASAACMKISVWVGVAAVMVGCGGSNKPAEGPAEKAGESVDNAADKTSDKASDLKDDAKDKADDVKEKVSPEKDNVDGDTH